jgi:hypothetical protein
MDEPATLLRRSSLSFRDEKKPWETILPGDPMIDAPTSGAGTPLRPPSKGQGAFFDCNTCYWLAAPHRRHLPGEQ